VKKKERRSREKKRIVTGDEHLFFGLRPSAFGLRPWCLVLRPHPPHPHLTALFCFLFLFFFAFSTLNRFGNERISFTRIHRPINVAILTTTTSSSSSSSTATTTSHQTADIQPSTFKVDHFNQQ